MSRKRSREFVYDVSKSKKQKHCNNEEYDEDGYEEKKIFAVDNHIYFRSAVSPSSVEKLIRILNKYNRDFNKLKNIPSVEYINPKPIYLHITSYGGCLLSGFRAVDAIKASIIPIYTVVDGYAASAASLMSVVGKRRFITPYSRILIHQLSSGFWGKFVEIEDDHENCKDLMDDMYEIYKTHTGLSKKKLSQQMKRDIWWNAKTCLNNGFIDEIYEPCQ